jgi:hypothetical protein
MNCLYFLRIFWCCLWGIIFEGSKFQLRKIVSGPRVSVRSLYKKGNHNLADRQRRCGWTNHRRQKVLHCLNVPGRHPPRRRWYTNYRRQQVLHCQKCPLPNEYASAPTPAPFFPDLSSTAAARPSFPAITHMSHYADSFGGARARSRVQGCWSSHNHSIGLDPVGELIGFPLVPCPDCGMAQVVEGRTQKQGENRGRLYFKCARNSVSNLPCLQI